MYPGPHSLSCSCKWFGSRELKHSVAYDLGTQRGSAVCTSALKTLRYSKFRPVLENLNLLFSSTRMWWVFLSLAASRGIHLQWWCRSRVSPHRASVIKNIGNRQHLWYGRWRQIESPGSSLHSADNVCNGSGLCGGRFWPVSSHKCS